MTLRTERVNVALVRVQLRIASLGLVLSLACFPSDRYACESDQDCTSRSTGQCIERVCAYPSSDCASGLVFSPLAGPRAGECTSPDASSTTGGSGSSTTTTSTDPTTTEASSSSGSTTEPETGTSSSGGSDPNQPIVAYAFTEADDLLPDLAPDPLPLTRFDDDGQPTLVGEPPHLGLLWDGSAGGPKLEQNVGDSKLAGLPLEQLTVEVVFELRLFGNRDCTTDPCNLMSLSAFSVLQVGTDVVAFRGPQGRTEWTVPVEQRMVTHIRFDAATQPLVEVWVDGAPVEPLQMTNSGAPDPLAATDVLTLGNRPQSNAPFEGALYHFALYPRLLSADEVQARAEALALDDDAG